MDYAVHGILQARILEWVAIPFFRESSQPRDRTEVSCMAGRFFTSSTTREAQKLKVKVAKLCLTLETQWAVACQAPPAALSGLEFTCL